MGEIKRILVGVDGSKCADAAAAFAGGLASKFGAEITLLHVHRPPETTRDLPAHELKSEAPKNLESAKELLMGKGIACKAMVLSGSPANMILTESSKGYDLLVLGSRGMGAMEGFLLGSISSKVVHHSKVPTLIVPCD
jgi:nucleotide-binding universal stress UspA family protein